MMSGLVLSGPEKLKGGHGQHQDPVGLQLLGRPSHGAGIVRDVLEHVEHPNDVISLWQRVWNPVAQNVEGDALLAAQTLDGGRLGLRPQDIAKARQHGQVPAAATAHLGDTNPL